ncbi:MAG: hypothetical protein Q8891_16650 [Bacteroidota bacterium]|nr:hypothetical protein [Bacteroidota bacterium]
MKSKLFKPVLLMMMLFIFSCTKKEKPRAEEILSDPAQQGQIMSYIMNDYSLMQKFLDTCMTNNKAKSMMLGHWNMMSMMMNNSGMISEIIKEDSLDRNDMMRSMILAASEDSAMQQSLVNLIMQNESLKNVIEKKIQKINNTLI